MNTMNQTEINIANAMLKLMNILNMFQNIDIDITDKLMINYLEKFHP